MNKLKMDYNNAVMAYIKRFELIYEMELDYWVSDRIGEVACLGDFFLDFNVIKYCIDNKVNRTKLIQWYDYCLEHEQFINIESFCKMNFN